MKKLIAVIALVSLLFLCSCQKASDMAYASRVSSESAKTVNDIGQSIRDDMVEALKESPDTFTLGKADIMVRGPTQVMAAVRNSKSSDAVFEVSVVCPQVPALMQEKSVPVAAGESEAFELEFNSQGIEEGNYMCTVTASSDQGDSTSRTLMVSVK